MKKIFILLMVMALNAVSCSSDFEDIAVRQNSLDQTAPEGKMILPGDVARANFISINSLKVGWGFDSALLLK